MAHTWWHVWGEIDKRHQKQWNTRDPNQNFYGVNDPRRAVRETTNRWSKKGSEAIDNLPEWVDPVKEVVGGVTKVVAGGLFGEGGLLRSDMNALGLQPVDALRAIDAGSVNERAELLNGRLAMIGVVAALGSYIVTGQLIPNIW